MKHHETSIVKPRRDQTSHDISMRDELEVMLAFAMLSFCAISSIVCLMTFAAPRADAIIGLVACWALAGDLLFDHVNIF